MSLVSREKAIEIFGAHYRVTLPGLEGQGQTLTATITECLGKDDGQSEAGRWGAQFKQAARKSSYESRTEADIQYTAALELLRRDAEKVAREVAVQIADINEQLTFGDRGSRENMVLQTRLRELQARQPVVLAQSVNTPQIKHTPLRNEILLPYLVDKGATIYRVPENGSGLQTYKVTGLSPVKSDIGTLDYKIRYDLEDEKGNQTALTVSERDSLGLDTLARYFDNEQEAKKYADEVRANPRKKQDFDAGLRF